MFSELLSSLPLCCWACHFPFPVIQQPLYSHAAQFSANIIFSFVSTGLHVAPTCLRVTAHFLCQVKLSHSTQSGFYSTIAFLYVFKLLATEQAVILLWCKAHQDKIEVWELALRVLVSCSSSTSLFPGIIGTDIAGEDSNTCGMNNLSVGEAFSLVTLISSHLLPLNIILPRLPALFIYFSACSWVFSLRARGWRQ